MILKLTEYSGFILALAALSFNLSVSQQAHADLPQKPPELNPAFTATQLPDGKYLVVGRDMPDGVFLRRLSDGKFLVVGTGKKEDWDKARIYDPVTRAWTDTGPMINNRAWHVATLLSNGNVLVLGGDAEPDVKDPSSVPYSCEIFNPASGIWVKTGSLNIARHRGHRATLLTSGKVLVTGGPADDSLSGAGSSAELYDPATGKWTITEPMHMARCGHTSILLTNGLVLVAGGGGASAELYNPISGKWTMTGSLTNERFLYAGTLLTNGQVLLTSSDSQAWEEGQELYDVATGQWKAIGAPRPHFLSSKDLDRTLTIDPKNGSAFLASQPIYFMVESADRFGVTNIRLFRDNIKIAESEESPMHFTLTNSAAGTNTFLAEAAYANGLASTSSLATITFREIGPSVFLSPGPTEFISETHVKTSPALLLARVVGVSPGSLARLTLNGVPQTLQTGDFVLNPSLTEGENTFVLVATDNQGRSGEAATKVFLDSGLPAISIKEPENYAAINAMCVDVHGTFKEKNLKQITVNEMPALISHNTFEVRNVLLLAGTNTITAIAENLAGNTTTNKIIVIGPTDINISKTIPVQVQVTPTTGFSPLEVVFNVQAHVPGRIQHVYYYFEGEGKPAQINSDLRPVAHTYTTSGEYFPVVTIQTEVGRFSNLTGDVLMYFGTPLSVNIRDEPLKH